MANKVTSMIIIRMILGMLLKGVSQRRIAGELHLSRNTVSQYTARIQAAGPGLARLQKLSDAELAALIYPAGEVLPTPEQDARRAFFVSRIPYFTSELKRTGVTRLLLWEEYRKARPDGYSYTQFCWLLGEHRKPAELSMHLEHRPGEVVMIDFAGDKMSYVDRDTGEVISCPVLVCILPYSGYTYACVLTDASIPRVIAALNACLSYFGGVPLSLKTDNMKQIVHKSCRYEPVFTEVFNQWSVHNNISLIAARVARPKDKAHVENGVKLTYQRIYAPLRDQTFFSIEELGAAVISQLDQHNSKLMQKKTFSRRDCFVAEEQPSLQRLPDQPYVLKHSVTAKVQKNYHITLGEDWHHYSVPSHYVGKTVTVIYDVQIVEIYLGHERIAIHQRGNKKHGYTTVKEHMPEGHRHYYEQRGWDADYFLNQACIVGPATLGYMQGMLKGRHFTEQTFNACRGLLRLSKEYSPARLEAACGRALRGSAFAYKTIASILTAGLDKEPLTGPQGDLFRPPAHDNLRGPQAYE
jgi:transposase